MQGKCCCGGCYLVTGAGVALIIAAVEAAIVLIWNIEVLLLLNNEGAYNPLHCVISYHAIDDFDVVHGLTLAAIGLNGFWLAFAILAARGNILLKHGHMAIWDTFTYMLTFFDLGATIYFAIKLQGFLAESLEFYRSSMPTKTLTYLTLLIAFSKGGILILVNIYLANVVQRRRKEVNHDHSALAMYVISHLSRCRSRPDIELPHHDPPPAYANSGPYYIPVQPASDGQVLSGSSDDSQWSLSNETLEGMSHEPPKYMPPMGRRKFPTVTLARALSMDPCRNATRTRSNVSEDDTSPILP